jgi:DNA-binding HxlR family transcriptional regulator
LVARAAERLVFALYRHGIHEVACRKWSLPTLLALHGCAERFNRLKDCLPGVTSRALSSTLKELCRVGLVERWVVDEYPPRTCYRLTSSAHLVVPLLERL